MYLSCHDDEPNGLKWYYGLWDGHVWWLLGCYL